MLPLRAFTPDRGFGINGRLCSALCLDGYDAGYVRREPKPPSDLPMRGDGFVINCKGCNREFVSKGLRCCSADCERKFKERQEIKATLAEIGEEAPTRPKCEVCGANIPRWRNGRAVKKGTWFCSPRCAQKARKAVQYFCIWPDQQRFRHQSNVQISGQGIRDNESDCRELVDISFGPSIPRRATLLEGELGAARM